MLRTRIAVLVSGGGTNLQALIDAQKAGQFPYGEIVLVVSNKRDAYALERAKAAGIDTAVVVKKKALGQADFEARLSEALEKANADMIVLAGFLAILSESMIKKYPQRILNIHPSLIPAFCGAGFYGLKVHEAALERGVKVTGATVHYVNEIPDGGQILFQKAVCVEDGDTAEGLQARVMTEAEWILLPKAVALVSEQIAREKQA